MKKIGFTAIFLIGFIFTVWVYGQPFTEGKTLKSSEVKQRWGNEKYDPKKFKEGDAKLKSQMAYSIMTDKTFVGKSFTEIRELFGQPDGFYFIDTYPAYIIQEGKNKTEETWQIVFRIGRGYKVRDVIVHKNCCTN